MKIATWNVNSIKARKENVLQWLEQAQPDILFMQELKGEADNFPCGDFIKKDYPYIAIHGQKTYNGVAVLSKFPIHTVSETLLDDDPQARYLEIEVNNIRMINAYMPNGNPTDSEKFPYKLQWMDALIKRCRTLYKENIPFLIGGDFNIIPTPMDCHDPKSWEGDALFRQESWEKWRALKYIGLYDAYRLKNPHTYDCYSFWDYQGGAWPQNKGIRIDHFLLSPELADRLQSCVIDREPRGWDKASDHTPVIIQIL